MISKLRFIIGNYVSWGRLQCAWCFWWIASMTSKCVKVMTFERLWSQVIYGPAGCYSNLWCLLWVSLEAIREFWTEDWCDLTLSVTRILWLKLELRKEWRAGIWGTCYNKRCYYNWQKMVVTSNEVVDVEIVKCGQILDRELAEFTNQLNVEWEWFTPWFFLAQLERWC